MLVQFLAIWVAYATFVAMMALRDIAILRRQAKLPTFVHHYPISRATPASVNEHASVMTPEDFARVCRDAKRRGLF